MFFENKELDKSVPVPLYFQLKELIIEEIKSGKYEVDSVIPTEKEISDRFGISRTTVRQAVMELVSEGWLYRVKSKGTFIARRKIKQDFLETLETFSDQMNRIGMKPGTEVLAFKTVRASEDTSEHLLIKKGDPVFYLFRRRFGDDTPVVTVETYLPFDACEFLQGVDFSTHSLYDEMASNDETKIYRAFRTLEAVAATASDAKYLDVKKGSPIQLCHTVGYNRRDVPLEYSTARYRGDMSSFHINVFSREFKG